jgi:hypothetical protein
MYNIGDKLEVATRMLTIDIPYETKIMTLTKIYKTVAGIYYSFDNNEDIHYPVNRIIRKVE